MKKFLDVLLFLAALLFAAPSFSDVYSGTSPITLYWNGASAPYSIDVLSFCHAHGVPTATSASNGCNAVNTYCWTPETGNVNSGGCFILTSPVCTSAQVLDVNTKTCVSQPICIAPQILNASTNLCYLPTVTCISPAVLNVQSNTCSANATVQTAANAASTAAIAHASSIGQSANAQAVAADVAAQAIQAGNSAQVAADAANVAGYIVAGGVIANGNAFALSEGAAYATNETSLNAIVAAQSNAYSNLTTLQYLSMAGIVGGAVAIGVLGCPVMCVSLLGSVAVNVAGFELAGYLLNSPQEVAASNSLGQVLANPASTPLMVTIVPAAVAASLSNTSSSAAQNAAVAGAIAAAQAAPSSSWSQPNTLMPPMINIPTVVSCNGGCGSAPTIPTMPDNLVYDVGFAEATAAQQGASVSQAAGVGNSVLTSKLTGTVQQTQFTTASGVTVTQSTTGSTSGTTDMSGVISAINSGTAQTANSGSSLVAAVGSSTTAINGTNTAVNATTAAVNSQGSSIVSQLQSNASGAASAASSIVAAINANGSSGGSSGAASTVAAINVMASGISGNVGLVDPSAVSGVPDTSSSFAALKGWTLPAHSSACPVAVLDFSGMGLRSYTMDQHCNLMSNNFGVLSTAMVAVWILLALFIVLSA